MQNWATGRNWQIKQVIKQCVYNQFSKCLHPHVVPHIHFHFKHILVKAVAKKTVECTLPWIPATKYCSKSVFF